jgi:tRNA modification GTPase
MASAEAAIVTRARQRSALSGVVEGLDEAASRSELELKAEGLRLASEAMARMTGEIGIEDVLDDVFGRFCIGK